MRASQTIPGLSQSSSARRLLYAATGAGFVAGAMLVAQAWLLSLVVDAVFLQDQPLAAVTPLLALMAACLLVRAATVYAETVLAQRAASYAKHRLRQELTAHLVRLGPIRLRGERTGELVNTVTEGVEALDAYITQFLTARDLSVLLPLFILVVILILDPLTTLVLIFAAPMLILMLAFIGGRARRLTERRFLELSWMSAFFLDMLQGLTTLKTFGRSKEQAATIEHISAHYGRTTMEVLATAFQTSLVMEWAATAATALVALEVSYRLMAGHLPFVAALTVLLLTPEFFLPLRTLALRYHAGAAGKAAAGRIVEILTTTPETLTAPAVRRPVQTPLPTIRFEDVFYTYPNSSRPALAHCTFAIPSGRCTALVGATGAGKSTIAQLLLHLLQPQQGAIWIGDTRIEEFNAEMWRAQIAWVPQHPHFFQGTVLDNLRLARPTATMDEIIAAAEIAHAAEFIHKLPQRYATLIGEQGARLSGGQRQRLALARAFLKDAPFLLLDEATAHLDLENERLVRAALARIAQGRTVLLIAHRLELTYTADQVVVLDRGQVADVGSHSSLLERGGIYGALVADYGAAQ